MQKRITKVLLTLSLAVLFSLLFAVSAFADFGTEAQVSSFIRIGDGTVSEWNDESCSPVVNAVNIDLAGIYIYAPRGYYVYSAELNGTDILKYALASATTTDIVVPAVTFSYNEFSNSPIKLVQGEAQELNITYAPLVEDSDIIVTYTAGVNELPTSLREQHAFTAEDGVHYIKGYGQEFAAETPMGWLPGTMKLIYPNGSSVEVCSGQRITPYQSCTVQIVYVLPVTVSVIPNLSANYGDTPPTGSDAYTFSVGFNADSSDISVQADVNYSSTAVGRHGVYLSNVTVMKNGRALSENELRLTVTDGIIDIDRAPLTITAGSAVKVYDGTALSNNSVTADNLKYGDVIEAITANCSITNAGTIENSVYGAVITNNGVDVTDNYVVTYVPGTLTVEPAPLSISACDCTAVYNGHPQYAEDFTVIGQLAEGDSLIVETSGTATYVSDGKVDSVPYFAAVYNADMQDVSSSYAIDLDTETTGSIRIVPRPISIIANSSTFTYTGSEIVAQQCGAVVSEDTPLADTDVLASVSTFGSTKYIGETTITVSDAHIVSGETDVSDNYAITYNPGKLAVVPDPGKGLISIELGGTKVYDGFKLSDAFVWTADELSSTTVKDVKVLGTTIGPAVTSKELSADDAEIALFDENGDMLFNEDYNIVVKGGNISITKQNLKISPTDASKIYDGNPYVGSINRKGSLSSGMNVVVSANTHPYNGDTMVSGIAAGSYTLRVDPASVKVTDENGKDISGNFAVSYDEAVLEVNCSISTANYSKSSGGTVTINCSVSPGELSSVLIDGILLKRGSDYSTANGSATIITFVNACLKELSTGNHTLTLNYENAGSINTTISVSDTGKTTSTALNFTLKK